MKEIKHICDHFSMARNQRKHELERGVGLVGTQGYEKQGCYKCDGYNYGCDKYFNLDKYMEDTK